MRFLDLLPAEASGLAVMTPGGEGVAYDTLRHDSLHLSERFERLGLPEGQRLGCLMPDQIGTPLATAVLMEHCSVLPLNPTLTLNELTQIAAEAGVTALLTDPSMPLAKALASALNCPVIWAEPGDRATDLNLTLSGMPIAAAHPPGLVLLTSGSTGAPKRVPLHAEQLFGSARRIASTLQLGPSDCALHALPMFHVGAVVDLFLAPLSVGGRLVVTDDRSPAGLTEAAGAGQATWMQLVPTMLARLLAELPADQAAQLGQGLRFIRSVSSDLSPDQQAKAEAHFGGTPLIQMYGMTETSGQITSNPLPPHARKPGSVGQPDGAEVAILDRTGARVPQGSVAEVCVRGQGVTAGYEATDRAAHFHADWLRTGDTGYLDADGYLFLAGRVKEMINRGGEKISPLEIERAALSQAGLQEAAAFALPHPTLGEHVGLAVVVDPGSGLTEVRILAHLRGQIAEYKLPRRVQMLEALPRLGSGKINKRALMAGRADAAKAPDWQGEAAVVAGLWQKILAAPVPGPDDDYFDMGGDSLSAMQFLLALEAKLGRKLPPNALYEAPRFEAFLARISKGDSHSFVGDGDPVLDHLRSRTFGWQGQRVGRYGLLFGLGTVAEKVPLFMCSQGETMAFRAVIDPGRPLYLMPSLSEFDGETPAIEQHVARIYADEIEAIQPEGLLYLSGFCGGVRLMREVAEELYARGRDIGFLTSVDKWFDRPTPYPVLHVFTENRRHSAVERFRKPHLAFPYLHPRGADWVRVKGNHSKALKVDPLRPAGAAIERWMQADGALPIPEAPQGLPVEARHRAYAAGVTVRHPRWFPRGQEAVLTVTLRNQSSEVWLPTSQSGLTFAAHFDNLDKHRRAPHVGHHDLTVPVAPGEEIRFDLRLRYPDTAMPQVLTCTMVDQGFAEFTDAPGRALRRLVWANPFTA